MKELSSLFESLYSHFVLRDVVAKVIPGLLALISILAMFNPQAPRFILHHLRSLTFVELVVIYGIGLMFGMLIQFLASRFRFTRIHAWPKTKTKNEEEVSVEKAAQFLVTASGKASLLRKRERLTIFKEMALNYAAALSLSLIALFKFIACSRAYSEWRSILAVAVLVVSITALVFQNRKLAREQEHWERYVISDEFQRLIKADVTESPESSA